MLGGAVAQSGETLGRVLDRPRPAEHVDRVQGSGPERVGDREHVALVVLERGRHLARHRFGRARQPPPRCVELGDPKAVVVEHGSHVGVGEPFGAAAAVVVDPERQPVETGRVGGIDPLGEPGAEREGA